MKKIYLLVSSMLFLAFTACTPEMQGEIEKIVEEAKGTYFISPDGDDNNSGHAPNDAWKSIDKLNSVALAPGNKIFFEGGKQFSGNIFLDQNDGNDPAKPILISTYGTGKATILTDAEFGIKAYNTSGFDINNLIIKGSGKSVNNESGIVFYNDLENNTKLANVTIKNTEISGFGKCGIEIGGGNGNSGFSDVLISNVKIHSILDRGISSYGQFSATKTGYAHANFKVEKSEVYNISGYDKSSHSGNGIVLADIQNSVIEYCTVSDSGYDNTNCGGPVGIWFWDADKVTIQFNEVYNMSSGTGCDGGGFDLDGGVTNGLMQYNYSHDNDGAGYLIGQFTGARPMNNIVVRYNISQNDAATNGGSVYLFNGATQMDNIDVYNNTLFITEQSTNQSAAAVKLLNWKKINGNINIFNNILYANNGAEILKVPKGYDGNFQGNLYHSDGDFSIDYKGRSYASLEAFRATGNEMQNGQPIGFQGDPKLQNAGRGYTVGFGNDLKDLQAYMLTEDSPAIDLGLKIETNTADIDFYGNESLQSTAPDSGAHEI